MPPHPTLSGLIVNPLVKDLEAGKATLVSIKYNSKFRDLTHKALEDVINPVDQPIAPIGMVKVNRKLAARLAADKERVDSAPADAKKKGAPPPAAAKKEAEPAKGKDKGKGALTAEEEQAEVDRLKQEEEERERAKQEELEAAFDKIGELTRLGGKVTDFEIEDETGRT